MRRTAVLALAMVLVAACAFAVDGIVLINQSTVTAGGGFPYIINQPGSYRLSGNLTAPLNIGAIQLASDGITLDLNGFTIQCSVLLPNVMHCLDQTGIYSNDVIRNGTILGLQTGGASPGGLTNLTGIYLQGERNSIEEMRITVPATAPFPTFGFYRTIAAPGNLRIVRNVLYGSHFLTCPSVLAENVHAGSDQTFLVGTGCTAFGNIGFGTIP